MRAPTVHSDFIQRISPGPRHVMDGMVVEHRRVGSMGYGRFAAMVAPSSSAAVPISAALIHPAGTSDRREIDPLATLITELEAP